MFCRRCQNAASRDAHDSASAKVPSNREHFSNLLRRETGGSQSRAPKVAWLRCHLRHRQRGSQSCSKLDSALRPLHRRSRCSQRNQKRDRCLAQSQLPRCQNSCAESAQSTNPWSRLQRATERARDLAAHCLPAISELRQWFVAEQDLDKRRMIRRPNAYAPARQTISPTLLRTPHSNEGE